MIYLDTIKEIEINESDETDYFINNKSIFMKKNTSDTNSNDNYINVENMKILNDSDNIKNVNEGELKKELDDFIINNRNDIENINNIVYVGGGKKNKIEIRQIDDKYKMKFDGEFSTLTEQNINLNNEKTIKKIRHRKYMRHIREKNKLEDLRDELLVN